MIDHYVPSVRVVVVRVEVRVVGVRAGARSGVVWCGPVGSGVV